MHTFLKILRTFDYQSVGDFLHSLMPALKYEGLSILTVLVSLFGVWIDQIFGMSGLALFAFLVVMVFELVSGVWASRIRKEPTSSLRLSRFTFKMCCYLIIIAVPYIMHVNYMEHGSELAGAAFQWLHIFLVIQIIVENVVSILENVGTITGKDKSFWIKKIINHTKDI